jgi:TonB family protein
MPFLPLVIGLVLIVAIIVGLWVHGRKTSTAPQQTETTSQPSSAESEAKPVQAAPEPIIPTPSTPAAAAPVSASPASSGGEVLSRDVPNVPERASNTIHGTVGVAVRLKVDPSGAVTNADFATRGPSAYFARIALESARNWKFKPPQQNGRAVPSTWLLHYKFRRGGVEVTPDQTDR